MTVKPSNELDIHLHPKAINFSWLSPEKKNETHGYLLAVWEKFDLKQLYNDDCCESHFLGRTVNPWLSVLVVQVVKLAVDQMIAHD